MALSIRDKSTETAVRRLARLKNKGLTETIREAVENELGRVRQLIPLSTRLESIGRDYAGYPETGFRADKTFFDDIGNS